MQSDSFFIFMISYGKNLKEKFDKNGYSTP